MAVKSPSAVLCVAVPQVLKVSGDGRDRTLLVLGEAFTPGSDTEHFCQPTDVAVDPETRNVFVSDGYCNARILKFAADGTYLTQWGAGSQRKLHIDTWSVKALKHRGFSFIPKNCNETNCFWFRKFMKRQGIPQFTL